MSKAPDKSKKVLVIGSGGREHAITWKLAQSGAVGQIYVAPGNGGTALIAQNVNISPTDIPALVNFARDNAIDLTIVTPDDPLAAGAVDAFKDAGLTAFGPSKKAAQIEASKAFAKDLMAENNIPTAEYKNFTDYGAALAYAKGRQLPLVVKASGLALGKGVIICYTLAEVETALESIMLDHAFGEAGSTVVVEDFLVGQEVSIHALSDGKSSLLFPATQDHKQINDGDKGPNTGGMGAFGPVSWITPERMASIDADIVQPALEGLDKKGANFAGCLYPGLMVSKEGVKVLEFNARFGDPETQVYMRLINADLYELLLACAKGKLDPDKISWNEGFAVCVVLASGGYPGDYKKGLPIAGLEQAAKTEGVVIFHAGTILDGATHKTAGGRVLNVTAVGESLDQAIERAYLAAQLINFDGIQYRHDIGRRPAPH